MKHILVTTKHRGVFYGQVADDQDMNATTMRLENARCAIRWNTTTGVAELAEKGPNEGTRVGAVATIEALHDITAIWAVTDEAAAKWNR